MDKKWKYSTVIFSKQEVLAVEILYVPSVTKLHLVASFLMCCEYPIFNVFARDQ